MSTAFNNTHLVTLKMLPADWQNISADDIYRYDKNDMLLLLIKLNGVFRAYPDLSLEHTLRVWFETENIDLIQSLIDNLRSYCQSIGGNINSLKIINMWSNLQLLEHINKIPEKSSPDTSPEMRKFMLKLYLNINGMFLTNLESMPVQLVALKNENVKDIALNVICRSISYHTINNSNTKILYYIQSIRADLFLSFLKERFPMLLAKFLNHYHCKSYLEYLYNLTEICKSVILNIEKGDFTKYIVHYSKQRQLILKAMMYKYEHLAEIKPDFINTRNKPLIQSNANPYIYLPVDSVLLNNKIFDSLIFELKGITESDQDLKNNYSSYPFMRNFLGEFNKLFIEERLCSTILHQIFQRCEINLSEDAIKQIVGNKDALPDYYVRSKNKVYLFEIKGGLLSGEIKQSLSTDKVEFDIQKKYHHSLLQLKKNIKKIFSDNVLYDPNLKSKQAFVYPVVLVSDPSLSSLGVNNLFQYWFDEALSNDPFFKSKSTRSRIGDIVVIDIDSLILSEDSYKCKHLLFEEHLKKYSRFRKNQAINNNILKSSLSFAFFTIQSLGKQAFKEPARYRDFIIKVNFDRQNSIYLWDEKIIEEIQNEGEKIQQILNSFDFSDLNRSQISILKTLFFVRPDEYTLERFQYLIQPANIDSQFIENLNSLNNRGIIRFDSGGKVQIYGFIEKIIYKNLILSEEDYVVIANYYLKNTYYDLAVERIDTISYLNNLTYLIHQLKKVNPKTTYLVQLSTNLGIGLANLKKFDVAKSHIDDALELLVHMPSASLEDIKLKSMVLHTSGVFYLDFGNFDKAVSLLTNAVDFKRLLGDHEDSRISLASSFHSLGNVYLQLQKFDLAKKFLVEAKTLKKYYQKNDKEIGSYALTVYTLGNALFALGEEKDGFDHLFESIKSWESTKLNSSEMLNFYSMGLRSLAMYYKSINNIEKAKIYFKKALIIREVLFKKDSIYFKDLYETAVEDLKAIE